MQEVDKKIRSPSSFGPEGDSLTGGQACRWRIATMLVSAALAAGYAGLFASVAGHAVAKAGVGYGGPKKEKEGISRKIIS